MMKYDENNIDKAIEAIHACIDKVPFLKIDEIVQEPVLFESRPDLLVRISTISGQVTLVIEVKNNGQPRIAREAIYQLQQMVAGNMRYYGIFMAPYIAEASADICNKSGTGYIDFSGNCRLSFGQTYIEIMGQPNKFAQKRELRSLYSPRASRILRVLLNRPQKSWKLKELAEEANVSLGQVANVKQMLLNREWLSVVPAGIFVSRPQELLSEWSGNYTYLKNRIIELYSMLPVNDLEQQIARSCETLGINYAFTGFSAAARLAPMVRYQKIMVYIPDKAVVQKLIDNLELKKVASGANILLMIPYDDGVYYGAEPLDDINMVSPVQVYLDLISNKGRGEEAAEEVLKEKIKTSW